MTNLVSVVTPVASYHTDLLPRCVASVEAQTIPCTHIIVQDVEQRGAGAARNQGFRQVETDFVVFLDADDWLEKSFIEECLNAYDEQHYIFTDWYKDEELTTAPDCAWKGQAWHCITSLLPTVWAKKVGGFDETLIAGEDTHFYMKLTRGGMCGKRLAMPLFHYGREGLRSRQFVNSLAYHALMKRLTDEFGGKVMGCCGDNPNYPSQPANEQKPGQIRAKALWGGNRQVHGVKTGELYERTGNGKELWVYPEDAFAAPHMFERVRPTPPPAPPRAPIVPKLPVMETTPEVPMLNGVHEVAAYVNENSTAPESTPQALPDPTTISEPVAPNVARVTRKAQRAMGQ